MAKTEQGQERFGRAKDRIDDKTPEMMDKFVDTPEVAKEIRHGIQISREEVQQEQGEIAPEAGQADQTMRSQEDMTLGCARDKIGVQCQSHIQGFLYWDSRSTPT